ncbi:MAG: hypothetical protein Q9227_000993 [Pyrenula ochraceoflavens]
MNTMNGYYNYAPRQPLGAGTALANGQVGYPPAEMPTLPRTIFAKNASAPSRSEERSQSAYSRNQSRASTMVNLRDPVTIHLLMETAMSDSMKYDVVSFEEIEDLKKEHALIQSRIEAAKRKYALECKLRDAAQSLSRLYSAEEGKDGHKISLDGSQKSPRTRRSFGLGHRKTSSSRSQEELAASTRKAEELADEIWQLEKKEQELSTKILRHTAGILQLTHKGMKKNVRRNELPQSPESMSDYGAHRSIDTINSVDGFDDRSLYRDMDQFDEYGNMKSQGPSPELLALQETEKNVLQLSLHLQSLMERSNSGQSPVIPPPSQTDRSLQSHISFFGSALEQLSRRVDHFMDQKSILTTQIQQQRDLNSKSDAERDGQIRGLTDQLAQQKQILSMNEQESQHLRDQIHLLMEQLDSSRQAVTLREQQSNMNESRALEAEKASRRAAEESLFNELKTAQDKNTQLQANISSLQNEAEINVQRQETAHRDLTSSNTALQADLDRSRSEIKGLEESVVRAQTELTVVRAELDGAYGTRAQRAAEVSNNPAVQAELDRLNEVNAKLTGEVDYMKTHYEPRNATPKDDIPANSVDLQIKVASLENELKETIEDYELMTKASIEFERERDNLEAHIDHLRDRCEALESQVSDEKVRWLGLKSPNQLTREGGGGGGFGQELTSTMVLKNEFKKMMRDTRQEAAKSLKAEQEERRRLENILRSIKKEQQQQALSSKPGSALSQSYTAS